MSYSLGIDTSYEVAVGIAKDGVPLDSIAVANTRAHAESLMPSVMALCSSTASHRPSWARLRSGWALAPSPAYAWGSLPLARSRCCSGWPSEGFAVLTCWLGNGCDLMPHQSSSSLRTRVAKRFTGPGTSLDAGLETQRFQRQTACRPYPWLAPPVRSIRSCAPPFQAKSSGHGSARQRA